MWTVDNWVLSEVIVKPTAVSNLTFSLTLSNACNKKQAWGRHARIYTHNRRSRDIWNVPEYFYWKVGPTCFRPDFHCSLTFPARLGWRTSLLGLSFDVCEVISCLLVLHICGETEFTTVCLYMSRGCCSLSRYVIDVVQSSHYIQV
jgi:hypothetical protein